MGQPRPLFHLFLVFSNKHYNFYNKKMWKNVHPVIQCRDSNPRPLERESLPITPWPGLPPNYEILFSNLSPRFLPPILVSKIFIFTYFILSLFVNVFIDQKHRYTYNNYDERITHYWAVVTSVGRAVASDTRDPQFESRHRQTFIEHLFNVNCVEKTKIKKKEAGNGHFKKTTTNI